VVKHRGWDGGSRQELGMLTHDSERAVVVSSEKVALLRPSESHAGRSLSTHQRLIEGRLAHLKEICPSQKESLKRRLPRFRLWNIHARPMRQRYSEGLSRGVQACSHSVCCNVGTDKIVLTRPWRGRSRKGEEASIIAVLDGECAVRSLDHLRRFGRLISCGHDQNCIEEAIHEA